jgi:hypothetical protein
MIRVIPFLVALLLCPGCATAIYNGGRFHDVLQRGHDRSEIRAALGVPLRSGEDQGFNQWPYDDFVVRGPVYDVSLSGGAAEIAAMTLCLSELIAVPQALWWKAFCRGPQNVRVLFEDDVHYTLHIVRPAPKAKDRSELQNHPATGNARSALQFAFVGRWPGVPEPGRSAN